MSGVHSNGMERPAITADEFEARYAERCGMDIATLRASGRVVVPCECDYEGCEGWQSMSRECLLLDLGIIGGSPREPIATVARAIHVAADFEKTMLQVRSMAGAA